MQHATTDVQLVETREREGVGGPVHAACGRGTVDTDLTRIQGRAGGGGLWPQCINVAYFRAGIKSAHRLCITCVCVCGVPA